MCIRIKKDLTCSLVKLNIEQNYVQKNMDDGVSWLLATGERVRDLNGIVFRRKEMVCDSAHENLSAARSCLNNIGNAHYAAKLVRQKIMGKPCAFWSDQVDEDSLAVAIFLKQ